MTGFTCTVMSSPRVQVFIASHADVLSGCSLDYEPKGRLRWTAHFANLEWNLGFCSVSPLSGGGVDANDNTTLSCLVILSFVFAANLPQEQN